MYGGGNEKIPFAHKIRMLQWMVGSSLCIKLCMTQVFQFSKWYLYWGFCSMPINRLKLLKGWCRMNFFFLTDWQSSLLWGSSSINSGTCQRIQIWSFPTRQGLENELRNMKAGVPLDCCKWGFKRLWAFVTAGDGLGLALPYSSLSLSPTRDTQGRCCRQKAHWI